MDQKKNICVLMKQVLQIEGDNKRSAQQRVRAEIVLFYSRDNF